MGRGKWTATARTYFFRPVSSILAEEISLQQEIAPVKSGGIIVPRDTVAKDHASAFNNLPSPPTVTGLRSASGWASLTTNTQIYIQIDERFQTCVEEAWLTAAARATLHACQRDELSISILVVDDDELRRYNRIYRQQDAPTDVLSFAVQEGPAPAAEVPDALAAELDADLGDLVLAFPYASRQAIQHGHTLAAELQLLVVHGTLHLLGYDHETETQHADMWRKQSAILSSLTDEDLTPRLTTPDW